MSATLAPLDRSLQQRMDALAEANRIRSRRAQLKRDVKARRCGATSILVDVPEWALTMPLVELLGAVPKVGPTKRNAMLKRCEVSPSKTLGGMSVRQRAAIVEAIGGR